MRKLILLVPLFAALAAVAQLVLPNPFYVAGLLKPSATGGGSSIPPGIDSNLSSYSDNAGTTSTATNSHTVPSGANRCLVVMVGSGTGGGAKRVTGITFNGGGTFTSVAWTNDANFVGTEIWCMTNAPVTTANLIVTWSGTVDVKSFAGINLTNVQQVASPFAATSNLRGTSFAPSLVFASDALQLPLGVLATDQQGTLSVTAGTQLWEFESIGGDVDSGGAYTTGAASITITWSTDSGSGENNWSITGASFLAP